MRNPVRDTRQGLLATARIVGPSACGSDDHSPLRPRDRRSHSRSLRRDSETGTISPMPANSRVRSTVHAFRSTRETAFWPLKRCGRRRSLVCPNTGSTAASCRSTGRPACAVHRASFQSRFGADAVLHTASSTIPAMANVFRRQTTDANTSRIDSVSGYTNSGATLCRMRGMAQWSVCRFYRRSRERRVLVRAEWACTFFMVPVRDVHREYRHERSHGL